MITAILNACGTYSEMSELFITLSSVSFSKGSACLSSFVGIWCCGHVDYLGEEIRKLSSERSVGVTESSIRLWGC